ncbi:DUF723 domain-containing protein [Vibrio sp. McD22-P3]|uniref:DUF723 domain-containing protein n=1 Tax=Vibrio sp. McD22-P3 TaxID=2724880 RepID=UPI003FCCF5DE
MDILDLDSDEMRIQKRVSNIDSTRKATKEFFLQQANKKFNRRYDYQYVDYYNNRTPVTIVCPVHGQFEQTPSGHLRSKTGCARCSFSRCSDESRHTKEYFLAHAEQKFGDRFGYQDVDYKGMKYPVSIYCPIHGKFTTTPYNHISSKFGCLQCARDYTKQYLR